MGIFNPIVELNLSINKQDPMYVDHGYLVSSHAGVSSPRWRQQVYSSIKMSSTDLHEHVGVMEGEHRHW